jgi:hypothetical protein
MGSMTNLQKKRWLLDNGGRRLGIERRHYSYSDHLPERRVNAERRNELDRRGGHGGIGMSTRPAPGGMVL